MLIQRHRFHGHSSVKAVYERGKGIRGGLISLKYKQRDPSKPYRVAVVVSRKVHKSAVTRNRIRRRVYEVIRTTKAQPKGGQDLVFTVFSEQVAELDYEELKKLVESLLKQAG